MGCVGSKEEIMAKAQSGLAAAKSYGASGFAELKELAECYNPLQAGGDPNSRCCLMLKEATELTVKVKTVEKEWKEFSNEAKGALDSSRAVLETPLPTLYTTGLPAGAQPTPNSELLGGAGFRGDTIESAKTELEARLAAGSYGKMDEWIATLKDLGVKQRNVNTLFANVEKAKKALDAAEQKVAELKARAANGDHKAAGGVPAAENAVAEARQALQTAQQAHDADEAAQFDRLKGALEQAPNLRGHIAAAMDAVAAAMTQAKSTIATPGASFKGGVPLSVPAPVALAVANEL